ncbi:MAG: response regulator transcription factor [Dictyoglomus sp.]|nr:response regulator transcription factor [Dictyoglomus sp.]MCX7942349.1 response regulator transcription factor [Dictyoglomaceae bacterium]
MMKKILLVEDDKGIVNSLFLLLTKEGYKVETAYNGIEALEKFKTFNPDLILLDLLLPEKDGWEVCKEIRKSSNVPIIMLTAKDQEIDKVIGLKLGADDYITKPFGAKELLARIEAVLRRVQSNFIKDKKIIIPPFEMDLNRRIVKIEGKEVNLSYREFEILKLFLSSPGVVLTRENIIKHIWGENFWGEPRTVDVYIRWLREKIEEDPSHPKYIVTVRNLGYKFQGGT